MKVTSHLNLGEKITNLMIKTRNEVEYFYPAFVMDEDMEVTKCALFTQNEVDKAIKRGDRNVEDVDQLDFENLSLRIHIEQDAGIKQEYEIARLKKELKEKDAEIENLAFELEYASRPWWKKLFGIE